MTGGSLRREFLALALAAGSALPGHEALTGGGGREGARAVPERPGDSRALEPGGAPRSRS
jgi:hypothetical protein